MTDEMTDDWWLMTDKWQVNEIDGDSDGRWLITDLTEIDQRSDQRWIDGTNGDADERWLITDWDRSEIRDGLTKASTTQRLEKI